MGHATTILTFGPEYSLKQIQSECDEWGDHNCDLGERNWRMGGGLSFPIRFTQKLFETESDAREYLSETFGNYDEIAVRFKSPKKKPNYNSAKIKSLYDRIKNYEEKKAELRKPHYAGVKSASVKCKKCNAVLPTAYCGKTYNNHCPVCREDLRPVSVIEKEEKYSRTIENLRKEIEAEKRAENEKAIKAGYDLCWAVACEVHC